MQRTSTCRYHSFSLQFFRKKTGFLNSLIKNWVITAKKPIQNDYLNNIQNSLLSNQAFKRS